MEEILKSLLCDSFEIIISDIFQLILQIDKLILFYILLDVAMDKNESVDQVRCLKQSFIYFH